MSQLEELKESIDNQTKVVGRLEKALTGDPLDPDATPGLVQEVRNLKNSFKHCPGRWNYKWQWGALAILALAIISTVIYLFTGQVVIP